MVFERSPHPGRLARPVSRTSRESFIPDPLTGSPRTGDACTVGRGPARGTVDVLRKVRGHRALVRPFLATWGPDGYHPAGAAQRGQGRRPGPAVSSQDAPDPGPVGPALQPS